MTYPDDDSFVRLSSSREWMATTIAFRVAIYLFFEMCESLRNQNIVHLLRSIFFARLVVVVDVVVFYAQQSWYDQPKE